MRERRPVRAEEVASPLLRYGLTAPWLVAATACSAHGAVFVLYVLVLGRVGCPRRRDAFCVRTRPFSDTYCVPRWSPRSPSVPGCACPRGRRVCMKRLPGSCGARRRPARSSDMTGPSTAWRAPRRLAGRLALRHRGQFLERLSLPLSRPPTGTERVTSSAPRQHRSERTGA